LEFCSDGLQLLEEMEILTGSNKDLVAKTVALYSSSEMELGFSKLTDLLEFPSYAKTKQKLAKEDLIGYFFQNHFEGESIVEKALHGKFRELFDFIHFRTRREAAKKEEGELNKSIALADLLTKNIKEIIHVGVLVGTHYFNLKFNVPSLVETVFSHSNPEQLAELLEKEKQKRGGDEEKKEKKKEKEVKKEEKTKKHTIDSDDSLSVSLPTTDTESEDGEKGDSPVIAL